MRRLPAVLALVCAARTSAQASAQPPVQTPRDPEVKTEYDAGVDSTTRSVSAYAVVDTSVAPPDTFALELTQRWKGQGSVASGGPLELGLGRTLPQGLAAARSILRGAAGRPDVVFVLDGARRVRLERDQYVSNAGERLTFETARYRISVADLRRVAEAKELRLLVGARELWLDPGWRRVAAEVVGSR
jgi:hypothetical protein